MTTPSSLLCAVHHLRDRIADPVSDVELLRRYSRNRDEDAFAALVRRHGGLVFNVARRQLRDLHHVEDVFQATFLALARSSAKVGELRSLTNWLYTVALRQARKTRQREMRRAEIDQSRTPPGSGPIDPLEVISGRELVGLIDEEFERLPENYRVVLLLCCIQGLSREEAAARLGWSVGTVKGRLERGRHRLADQLAKKGIVPSALFLSPFADTVPEPLMNRAVALAASPWARSIPTSVVELLGPPAGSKLLPFAFCFMLFALGWTIILLQPGDGKSPPPSPRKPIRADTDPLKDPLPKRAIRRFGTARYRPGEPIVGLSVSPDDRFAVAFGKSYGRSHRLARAGIYDLRDGRRLAKLSASADSLFSFEAVAIAPDGKTVATKQSRGIHLHDPKTGVEIDKIRVYLRDRNITYWLTFSPDGSKIALSSGFKDFQIIDLKTKKMLHKFTHTRTVNAGVFSPDGKLFAAGDHYWVRLWDVGTGKQVRRYSSRNPRLDALAFSPDGKTLAGGGGAVAVGGGGDGWLHSWNVATAHRVIHMFEKNGDRIRSVAFAHDGKTIAAAGENIRLYDVATKKERLRIPRRARGLHFSASDKVLTAAVDGAIYRWDTKTGKTLTPQGCDSGIEQIRLANNGRTVVTRDQAGIVHLWDRATGKHLRQMQMDRRRELAVSPNGQYLVLSKETSYLRNAKDGRKLLLYHLASGRYINRFSAHDGYTHDKELTPDGKTLVTVDHLRGNVRLWDVATGEERRSFIASRKGPLRWSSRISGSVLSPDGKTLAVAQARLNYPDGTFDPVSLRLWDVTTGKELVQLEGHYTNRNSRNGSAINGLAFSPDGRFLASCTQSPSGARHKADDELFIWNVKTGRQIARLSDKGATSAYRVAFSPDGRTLASASLDGTVRVWEVATRALRTRFRAHRDCVSALHFAADGTLFTGSFDSTVLAWNVRPDKTDKDTPLAKAWTRLLDPKAGTAYPAQGRLLATPGETVAFLTQSLHPVAKVDDKRVAKLLADLDSERFASREAAFQALRKLGRSIKPTLLKTLAKAASSEVRRSVKTLLSELESPATPPAELRILRAVELLEWLATSAARKLLSKLATGEPNALLTRASALAVKRLRARGEQVSCCTP